MAQWTDNEVGFLQTYINLRPIEVYGRFAQEFGHDSRTYDAVQKQLKKLRDNEDFDEELVPIIDLSLYPVPEEEDTEEDFITDYQRFVIDNINPSRLKNRERMAVARVTAEEFVDDIVEMSQGYEHRLIEHSYHEGAGSTLVVLLSDTHCGKNTTLSL